MPFVHLVTFHPANGQVQALRQVLEGRVKLQQEAGYRCGLGQVIYGTDWPQFDISFAFDDLAALEAFRVAVAPTMAGFSAQAAALTARPPRVELLRTVVPLAVPTPPAYVASWIFFPTTGKFPQLRDALAQNVREDQEEGARVAMAVLHAGPPSAYVRRLADSLADLEQLGPEWNEARAKRIEGLFSAPPASLIRQVLIAVQSR